MWAGEGHSRTSGKKVRSVEQNEPSAEDIFRGRRDKIILDWLKTVDTMKRAKKKESSVEPVEKH